MQNHRSSPSKLCSVAIHSTSIDRRIPQLWCRNCWPQWVVTVPNVLFSHICFPASIRAYGAQTSFIDKSLERINKYTRAARTFYNLTRWICIRINAMGGLFAAGLATYLVYFQKRNASETGFSLNMAGTHNFYSRCFWFAE